MSHVLTALRRSTQPRSRTLAFAGVALATLASAAIFSIASSAGGEPLPSAAEPSGHEAGRRPAPKPHVSIAAVGDVAMGRAPVLPPDGGAGIFRSVAPHLRANVVLGNLEQALANRGPSKCGAGSESCFAFRTPPAYALLLRRAGFTVMNVANNHSYDFGQEGLSETLAALDRFHLLHTGQPGEIAVAKVDGLRVAFLGFAPYAWAQDLLDVDAATALVRTATRRADLVIVTMHAGAEGAASTHVRPGPETYLGEPRGDSMAFARAVVDAGADLVVGHGPHVLRGMEWYRERLIAYSLGNFSAYSNFALSGPLGVSVILRVTLRRDGSWAGGRLVPVQMVDPGTPMLDPRRSAHALVTSLSRQDFGRRAVRVDRSGRIVPPRTHERGA